jgi:phosphoesterase RecJ-like protein
MSINWPRFTEIVRSNQRFLLTSHVRPDCDALGSELAMAGVLESLGKSVRIVNGQETPPVLQFIDPTHKIQSLGKQVTPADLADIEVLMVLDTSAWMQLGPMADVLRSTRAIKIVLDHHVSGDDLGAELFKNPSAEATGRLVIEAADQLGVSITRDIATTAFAALATDTGWFRFNSTTGDTLRLAGRLIDAGAHPQTIYTSLYEQDTLGRLRLRGMILARAQIELDGRLIYTAALTEDFAASAALPSDTEDVINLTLGVSGVEVAVIFVQTAPRRFKISFRSRGAVACNKVAERFGGGGHHAAAGATVDGTYDEVRDTVLDVVRAALR